MSAAERRAAAALLRARADTVALEQAAEWDSELRHGRPAPCSDGVTIMRSEARRLATTRAKARRSARRGRRLSVGASGAEILRALETLRGRVAELTMRIDRAYEETERDEVEREAILEALAFADDDSETDRPRRR